MISDAGGCALRQPRRQRNSTMHSLFRTSISSNRVHVELVPLNCFHRILLGVFVEMMMPPTFGQETLSTAHLLTQIPTHFLFPTILLAYPVRQHLECSDSSDTVWQKTKREFCYGTGTCSIESAPCISAVDMAIGQ